MKKKTRTKILESIHKHMINCYEQDNFKLLNEKQLFRKRIKKNIVNETQGLTQKLQYTNQVEANTRTSLKEAILVFHKK